MKNLLIACILFPFWGLSQQGLLQEIDTARLEPAFEKAAFKGLKVVNLESTKMVSKNELYFIVQHRFGSIKSGVSDLFGLDRATTQLNFVYGLTDGINIGLSRSSFQKTYEGSLKLRLLRQKQERSPLTVVLFQTLFVNTALDRDLLPGLTFEHRLGYSVQTLVSRKFSKDFSLELAPIFFHDNLSVADNQENSQFALGIGGRLKLTPRWSFNADYGLHLNRGSGSPYNNPLSIGFDMETGGHVFQLHFTNAQPMGNNYFLGRSSGDWTQGDIFFGFNISRVF